MQNLAQLMSVYEEHHTKLITKITHFIGVPAIIFAIQIVFYWIHLFTIPLAWIAVVGLLIYYFSLDKYIAVVTGIFLILITYLAQIVAQDKVNNFALILAVAAFVGGWIAQLVGHYYEGKRPALVDNIFQIFVAPIFLVAELCYMLGYKPRR